MNYNILVFSNFTICIQSHHDIHHETGKGNTRFQKAPKLGFVLYVIVRFPCGKSFCVCPAYQNY